MREGEISLGATCTASGCSSAGLVVVPREVSMVTEFSADSGQLLFIPSSSLFWTYLGLMR